MLGLFCESGVGSDDSSCCWSEFLGRLKMYSVVSVMKLVDSFTNVCEITFVSYRMLICEVMGFPGGSTVKKSNCQCRRPRFDPWIRKIQGRTEWLSTPVFLPEEFHGQRINKDFLSYVYEV